MAETWLTIEAVCELEGWSTGHARRASRAWPTRLCESRGRNGKHRREYPLSSLSAGAQAKHADLVRKNLAVVQVPTGSATLPLFASAQAAQAPPRVAVPEDLEDQARARLAAIEPYLDAQQQRKQGLRTEIRLAGGKIVRTMGELAQFLGSQQKPPVGKQAVWEWVARFNEGGYAALADRPRKDKDKSRFFEEHAAAAIFLQNKFLKEGLSREMAWEALCREWRKVEKKGEPPCYDTARNYLNALPEPLKVMAREGQQAYWSKCSPFIQRAKVPVMDWWISDHRVFDVMVRNSLFFELTGNKAFRIWLTAIYDWGSRKLVGFCFAPTPSSRTINSALRMAILSHGMPRNFLFDQGEDFKKIRRDIEAITLSDGAQGLFKRDRVGVTSALPYRPRSKPIEAFFTRWAKRFDPTWRPAYLGHKPGACPEDARKAQKLHDDFLRGKRDDSPLPLDAEFIAGAIQFIEDENSTRLDKLDGRTPNEAMEEAHPERNRPKINPRLLDILFSEREIRKVDRGGCVKLDRMRYEPTEESAFALSALHKRTVLVLRDPFNLQEATAVDAETLQFIGELRIQEFVAQCPNGRITRDQIKAGLRRERSYQKGYAEYLAALSAISASSGWKTEREDRMERLGFRTGTDARLLPAGVPGALGEGGPAATRRRTSSAFVSDDVASDADVFGIVELQDDTAEVDSGERNVAESDPVKKISSPFVSDEVRDFLAKEPKP